MEKQVIGRIDCPTCGMHHGMRVTTDKNGDPFGYCDGGCRQQLRIGGDPERVAAFRRRHTFAAVPVTVTEQKPEPEPIKNPVTVTEPEPEKTPVTVTPPAPKRKATFMDALSALGVPHE